jgi:hypothetical protein
VVVVSRAADGAWQTHEARAGETVVLSALGCGPAVDDVYRGVALAG